MKLNHLDLQVADVPALAQFLVDHYEFSPLTRPDSPKLAILTDGHGFTLVIQRRQHDGEVYPGGRSESDPLHVGPEGAHIGFLVDDPAEVYERRARIAAAGVAISEVDVNARGTTCYCRGPGGILIELGCRVGTRVAV